MQVSQYLACSNNKLNFIPGTGNSITNGVVTVSVPYDITGVHFQTVQNWVTAEVLSITGKHPNEYTHAMYVLPQEVKMDYAAYAYYNYYLSLYNGGL